VGEIGYLLGRLDVAREEDDAAEIEPPRERAQLGGQGGALEADDRELSDLAVERFRHAVVGLGRADRARQSPEQPL